MIEVATRTSNPRSRGERTKRRQRHLIMSKEKEKHRAVSVNIALSNEKNGNYILVSIVSSYVKCLYQRPARAEILEHYLNRPEKHSVRPRRVLSSVLPIPDRSPNSFYFCSKEGQFFFFLKLCSQYRAINSCSFEVQMLIIFELIA